MQIVLNDKLLLFQVVSQEAIMRLLVEKEYSAKKSFWKW
jgi:hypothetical protein